jgi:hypothetical protein
VLRPGPDAKLAVAKGAAIAEWYETVRPEDFTWPDQEVVSVRINDNLVLPYSLFTEQGGNKSEVLRRGTSFRDPDSGELKNELAGAPLSKMEKVTIYHVLRVNGTVEMRHHCQFDCEEGLEQRPPQIPADAIPQVEVRVNREFEVLASLQWVHEGKVLATKVPLKPHPVLPEDTLRDPFSGMH